jgi:phenylalanyl-tRNA synthetase alpha chain
MSIIEALQALEKEALSSLEAATSAEEVESWRIEYLSRQGKLPKILEGMRDVAPADRPAVGKAANTVKSKLSSSLEERQADFEGGEAELPEDPSLPGKPYPDGSIHVLQQTRDEMVSIFRRLGFALAEGPEIETEFKNFDALNTPPDHPARNEQDTFYLNLPPSEDEGRYLLRTHTSPVQIRTMLESKPPIRIIAPGRCFRRDEVDATHGMFFNQIEGLLVDRRVNLGHMKGTLEFFFREFMGVDTEVRFRPHFFPFTEPSFEADMRRTGMTIKGKSWTEVAGCGMVDPQVFESVGIDPDEYTGFAFGIGIERMAMIRHRIGDLRLFYENDIRFLSQF